MNKKLNKDNIEQDIQDIQDMEIHEECETEVNENIADCEEVDGCTLEETCKEEDLDSKAAKKAHKADKKKDKKHDPMKEKVEELEDKVRRQMAEFDNFRKRTEKEKSAMFEVGAKSVVEKILPVIDNFERGLSMSSEGDKATPFYEGMNMIYKQMMQELENIGVKPIEAVGKEFDPNLHNAVMQVENDELESGSVAAELQKGYTYRDSVVRHSMVSVVS